MALSSIVWGSVSREITQPYGPAHRGIDIGLNTGTPLFAARTGVVWAVGYGYLAIAVDGTDQRDWYLHIDSAVVGVDQHVNRGQQVAYSGAKQVPGGPPITGPHLHFEVQTGQLDVFATSLDPVPVLKGLFSGGSGGLGGDMATRADSPELFSMLDLLQLGIFGKSSADSRGLEGDVAELKAQMNLLQLGIFGAGAADPAGLQADVAAVLTAVKALPAGSVAIVDLKPVLDGIAAVKAELDQVRSGLAPADLTTVDSTLANVQTIVAAIRAKTDKDLA